MKLARDDWTTCPFKLLPGMEPHRSSKHMRARYPMQFITKLLKTIHRGEQRGTIRNRRLFGRRWQSRASLSYRADRRTRMTTELGVRRRRRVQWRRRANRTRTRCTGWQRGGIGICILGHVKHTAEEPPMNVVARGPRRCRGRRRGRRMNDGA